MSRPPLVRRSALPVADVVERGGMPVTSPLRTVFDLSRHLPLTEAVVAVDMALHQTLVGLGDLREYAAAQETSRGSTQVRRVMDLAEPRAESQMETRLRMLLVLSGLPRPDVQVEVNDEGGVVSWAGSTFTTLPGGSEWNTTARCIVTTWWRTTAARIAFWRRASGCSAFVNSSGFRARG
jgi:hypothetical protein